MKIGLLCSRIRVEEKLLITELSKRGIEFDIIDDRKIILEIQHNGWDYDGIAQDLEMDYEEAVIHLFLYCVAKIKLELFMRESE